MNTQDHVPKKTIKLLKKTKISKQKTEWVKNEILLGYKRKTWEIFSKTQTNTKLVSK